LEKRKITKTAVKLKGNKTWKICYGRAGADPSHNIKCLEKKSHRNLEIKKKKKGLRDKEVWDEINPQESNGFRSEVSWAAILRGAPRTTEASSNTSIEEKELLNHNTNARQTHWSSSGEGGGAKKQSLGGQDS